MKFSYRHTTSWLALAALGFVSQANSQTIDNNFNRDRSVAVSQRAKAEYTPLGLRLGAFDLQPALGVSIGANDNIFYDDAIKESDSYFVFSPSIDASSHWSRHMLSAGLKGALSSYSSNSSENTDDLDLHANGRFDISSRINAFGALSHVEGTESRANPLTRLDAIEPVKTKIDAASVGFTVVGNRIRFIGTTSTTDMSYEDVEAADGTIINEHVRDFKTSTLGGRLDYALSPNISVFLNAEGNKRQYDASGLDSSGSIWAVGTSFDLDKLARGEIQIGSITQDYDSASTGRQNSFYYNGKVEYFPTQLTTITLNLNRAYSETVSFGATSALTSSGSIGIDHELLRNLVLSALVSYNAYDFSGIDRDDRRSSLYLGAQYFMNPRMSLVGSYKYDKLNSKGAEAYRNYTDNALEVGILFKY